MAEQSGFFDAHLIDGEYDRVYLAENFARYFASFIGNGIFGGKSNELMVQQKAIADMSIRVLPGQGWINGYWYENDDELSLSIDIADGVLNRIDIVVLRWDNIERVIRLGVKKGTPASNPSAPQIQRDADYFELKIAQVYVKAGATKITQVDITDTRYNEEVCGLVVGVVQQLDTDEFGKQLEEFVKQFIDENEAWFEQFKKDSQSEINEMIKELEDILNEEDVVAINNKIAEITQRVVSLEAMNIEDGLYSGCFYRRPSSGGVEWVNAPNEPGIEYMTTERWKGKPVSQITLYVGSLPNKTVMTVKVDARFDKIISVSGFAIDSDNNMCYPFPIILSGLTTVAVIQSIEGDGGDGSIVVIQTNEDISNFVGYITVKYVKE